MLSLIYGLSKWICLWFFLSGPALSLASPVRGELTSVEKLNAYLEVERKFYSIIQFNILQIRNILRCLNKYNAVDIDLDLMENDPICQAYLNKVLIEDRKDLRTLRVRLGLSQFTWDMGLRNSILVDYTDFESFKKTDFINPIIKNPIPISSIVDFEDDFMPSMAPLSPDEINEAFTLFKGSYRKKCLEFKDSPEWRELKLIEFSEFEKQLGTTFCDFVFANRVDRSQVNLNSKQKAILRKTSAVFGQYQTRRFASVKRTVDLKLNEVLSSKPYLLYFSAGDSDIEYRRQLKTVWMNVYKHQMKTIKRISQHNDEIALSRRSDSADVHLEKFEDYFRSLFDYDFILKSLMFSETLNDQLPEVSNLVAQHIEEKKIQEKMEFRFLIAANIACFLPWGRYIKGFQVIAQFLKIPAGVAFRDICLATMDVPVNTYFLSSDFFKYERLYSTFFLNNRDSTTITEFNQLDPLSQNLILSALLAPIGIGEFKKVIKELAISHSALFNKVVELKQELLN